MPRVRKGAARARKHKRVLKSTRGHIGAASRRYHVAREAVLRAGQHAVIGRKLRKRDFRRLWITRISAACRQRGVSYSRFMHGLSAKGIAVNRKVLADLAVADPGAFDELVTAAMAEAPAKPAPEAAPPEKKEKAQAPAPAKPAPKKKAAKKAVKKAVKKAAPKKTAKKKTAAKKPKADAKQ